MMKRLVSFFLLFLALQAHQAAAETFTSPRMVETGWTDNGDGTVTGSNVRSLKMAMKMSQAIADAKDRWWDVTFTVSGYSGTGSVRAFVGVQMPSTPTGSWVLKSAITPVADRFTLGIGTPNTAGSPDFTVAPYNLTGPGLSAEDIGSMRIFCTHAKFGFTDPVLYPNLVGAGHIHEFVGNTDVQANWTYNEFRTRGASTCQDNTGTLAKYPVNPSGYWWPALLDGAGHVVKENQTLIYYKGPPNPGLNYSTAPSPLGGTATASGSTLTRVSGAAFNVPGNGYAVGGTIYFAANNLTAVGYTITAIPDADHITVSGSPPAITGLYGPFPKEIYNAAANQCNDEWGGSSLTVDPNTGATVSNVARCPQWPHGIKFIFGYNKANGQGRPDTFVHTASGDNGTGAQTSGTKGLIAIECWKGPNFPGEESASASGGLIFDTMSDLVADIATNPSHCPIGSVLHYSYGGPTCWDGQHVDSPDHRAHVAFGQLPTASGWLGNQRCPSTHPYPMPQMSVQNFYTVDQNFRDGKWRLSIDEMVDGLPAGMGSHMDYIFAWSPTASDLWFTRCTNPHNSCTNELGNGQTIPGPKNWDQTGSFCNGCAHPLPDRYVRVENYGMSWDYKANGTYTVRIKSAGAGQWGFMGKDGFNGTISNISAVQAPDGAKGPVTVHN